MNEKSFNMHGIVYRAADKRFMLQPLCGLCQGSSGNAFEFSGTLVMSAAYVCDKCIEKHQNDNLSLADTIIGALDVLP